MAGCEPKEMTLREFVNEIKQYPNSELWKIEIKENIVKISSISEDDVLKIAKRFCLSGLNTNSILIADYGEAIVKITKTE